jgi:hypothetical protein
MTQPERSEVGWSVLAGIDLALRQLEAALPEDVKIVVEIHTPKAILPIQLEYSRDSDVDETLRGLDASMWEAL